MGWGERMAEWARDEFADYQCTCCEKRLYDDSEEVYESYDQTLSRCCNVEATPIERVD